MLSANMLRICVPMCYDCSLAYQPFHVAHCGTSTCVKTACNSREHGISARKLRHAFGSCCGTCADGGYVSNAQVVSKLAGKLSKKELCAVELMSKGIVNKLLHGCVDWTNCPEIFSSCARCVSLSLHSRESFQVQLHVALGNAVFEHDQDRVCLVQTV